MPFLNGFALQKCVCTILQCARCFCTETFPQAVSTLYELLVQFFMAENQTLARLELVCLSAQRVLIFRTMFGVLRQATLTFHASRHKQINHSSQHENDYTITVHLVWSKESRGRHICYY